MRKKPLSSAFWNYPFWKFPNITQLFILIGISIFSAISCKGSDNKVPLNISLVGIYQFEYTEQMFIEQKNILYGRQANEDFAIEQIRDQMDNTVVIELLIENNEGIFDVDQIYHGSDRMQSPVPWNEQYLDRLGTINMGIRWPEIPNEKNFRMVFYLIQWNKSRPLLHTQKGEIECPNPSIFPARLKSMIHWYPLD